MHLAHKLSFCARFTGLALLLVACKPVLFGHNLQATVSPKATGITSFNRAKTESVQGDFVGPATDCDGDGFDNDSRIDFDGDGVADECVTGREEVPEPPFQQDFSLTKENFYSLIPEVGWSAQYQCGEDLYEVTLRRPSENKLEYVSEGLVLSSEVVYDDIDPNLNQPLVIKDPIDGLRYSFQQARDGEFYEYAVANYNGNVGLYVYQTGEQVVAAPCQPVAAPGSVGAKPASE